MLGCETCKFGTTIIINGNEYKVCAMAKCEVQTESEDT